MACAIKLDSFALSLNLFISLQVPPKMLTPVKFYLLYPTGVGQLLVLDSVPAEDKIYKLSFPLILTL